MFRPLALLFIACGTASCAHAAPLTLSCRFGDYEEFRFYPDHVEHDPRGPRSAEVFLNLDFAAKTFAFSNATGTFEERDGMIIMTSRDGESRTYWELERQNGGLSSTTYVREENYGAIEHWSGQCEPESGTPF